MFFGILLYCIFNNNSFILLRFVTVAMVYLIAGGLFMYIARNARSLPEIIPNGDFWKSLPGLAKVLKHVYYWLKFTWYKSKTTYILHVKVSITLLTSLEREHYLLSIASKLTVLNNLSLATLLCYLAWLYAFK